MEREWSQFQTKLALYQGYSMVLVEKLQAARLLVPTTPKIPS